MVLPICIQYNTAKLGSIRNRTIISRIDNRYTNFNNYRTKVGWISV